MCGNTCKLYFFKHKLHHQITIYQATPWHQKSQSNSAYYSTFSGSCSYIWPCVFLIISSPISCFSFRWKMTQLPKFPKFGGLVRGAGINKYIGGNTKTRCMSVSAQILQTLIRLPDTSLFIYIYIHTYIWHTYKYAVGLDPQPPPHPPKIGKYPNPQPL